MLSRRTGASLVKCFIAVNSTVHITFYCKGLATTLSEQVVKEQLLRSQSNALFLHHGILLVGIEPCQGALVSKLMPSNLLLINMLLSVSARFYHNDDKFC